MKIPLIAVPLTLMAAIMLPVFPAFAQGPLTPPGAPAPSMKTLAQIEPRTPISSLPYTISSPGAYYVATNTLTGTSGNSGITISANNVTLDLMGFTMAGGAGATHGIYVPNPQMNIIIRNGILVNWPGYGINASNAIYCQFSQINVSSNAGGGLVVGNGSTIDHCAASSNGPPYSISGPNGSGGITAGTNSVIKDCVATFNTVSGITTGDNATIINCTACQNNTTWGGAGIYAGNYSTIIGCAANANGNQLGPVVNGISAGSYSLIKDCTANDAQNGNGITSGGSSKIRDCVANGAASSANGGYGVSAGDASSITGCMINNNKYGGIYVGNYCSIFDNTCLGNQAIGGDYDIACTGSANTVNHNTVTTSSAISAGANNLVGTIVTGSSSMNSGVNPHANFASP